MNSFIVLLLYYSILLRGVVGHVLDNRSNVQPRRSLSLGIFHPQAVFNTGRVSAEKVVACSDSVDSLEVAKQFIQSIISPHATFELRSDSYRDPNTGVTHAYARQLVHGLEVIDGDINVNIQDCSVISYGNSFFVDNGDTPSPAEILQVDIPYHSKYINQVVMGSPSFSPRMFEIEGVSSSIKMALLEFMLVATPSQDVVQNILADYQSHLENMAITSSTYSAAQGHRDVVLVSNVPDSLRPVKAYLAYAQIPNGDSSTELELVWKYEVEMVNNWYEAAVSVSPPHRIISIVDWVADAAPVSTPDFLVDQVASYNAFALGINDPSEGNRSVLSESPDVLASPLGWHVLPVANDPSISDPSSYKEVFRNTTTTWGNNVFAHENWAGLDDWISNHRPDGGEHRVFDFGYDPILGNQSDALSEARAYINASVTHLFYTTNVVHDLYYRYGFDEISGNFQQYNFERGGKENDAIIADAQDGSGLNNANFLTPPDGQNPRCRMYLWNTAYPWRDGVFDGGVLIHELSHGLVARLTGGPDDAACIGFGESTGMSEGWADFFATVIRSKPNISDYPSGSWISNKPQGARHYLYSTNMTVNPVTYKTLDNPAYKEVHAMGEVWAEMLWVLEQDLVAKHGYGNTLFPPSPLDNGTIPAGDFYKPIAFTSEGSQKPLVPKYGNTLAMQLVIDGLKLQPCRPSFFNARDAIIQADQLRTGGENFCTLWKSFASRGLGPGARWDGKKPWGGGVRKNDFSAPAECEV